MKQQKWICILFIMAAMVSSNSIIEAGIMDPLTEIKAVRTTENIKIDGILSEAIWSGVGYTNLIQRSPVEGADPSKKTEVYIAYNDLGLDIKYGLTGDLTLDLAVNPDFGQAEVDSAGNRFKEPIEPLTNYNIFRGMRESC